MNSSLQFKDKKLKEVVLHLMLKFENQIKIMDFWEADLCAIGICDNSEKQLIYISTFGLPHGRYNTILEKLKETKECKITIGEFNNVSLLKLEKLMIDHLKIV